MSHSSVPSRVLLTARFLVVRLIAQGEVHEHGKPKMLQRGPFDSYMDLVVSA